MTKTYYQVRCIREWKTHMEQLEKAKAEVKSGEQGEMFK